VISCNETLSIDQSKSDDLVMDTGVQDAAMYEEKVQLDLIMVDPEKLIVAEPNLMLMLHDL
jgi:hypothetical protein